MKNHEPFRVVRIREAGKPKQGRDLPNDLLCVQAQGNIELQRRGETPSHTLINGCLGKHSRQEVQKLCDALNAVWQKYLDGKL